MNPIMEVLEGEYYNALDNAHIMKQVGFPDLAVLFVERACNIESDISEIRLKQMEEDATPALEEYDRIMQSNSDRKRDWHSGKKRETDRRHGKGKKRNLSRKQIAEMEWNDIWTCVENKHNHAVSVIHLCERKKTVNLRNNKKAEVMRQKEKEYKNNFDYLSVLAELKIIEEKMIAIDQKIEEENEELSNFYYRCCADGDDIIIMNRTCINQLIRYRDKLSEERYDKLDELFMMEEGF